MQVSNADRIVYPEPGLTKGDVVAYYAAVADRMLPHLADRPLTLQRFPKGLSGPGFMQKNAPSHYPDSISRWEVPKNDGGVTSYPVVHEAQSIPYLANQGTITFHAWTSTVHHPWNPDWLVIDLDPFEGDVGAVRDVAAATKEVLDAYDLASIPVATGSKGFHIWVRLEPTLEYGAVSRAANAIGAFVQLAVPHAATREFLKKEREGKVFVDWLRNSPGATVAVPFTLRPRPNASVAMPFDWSDLHDVRPDQWTLTDALESIDGSPGFPEASTLPIEALEAAAVELGVDLDISFDRFGRER